MSVLDGQLEAGDVVNVTYYSPLPNGGTIEEHRAGKVYKRCERVTLSWVGYRDGSDVLGFCFTDHCHPSCGGVSYGDLSWADVEHAVTEGALF